MLETEYLARGPKAVHKTTKFSFNKSHKTVYEISYAAMQQVNIKSKTIRPIYRKKKGPHGRWQSPAQRAALAANMREVIKANAFDGIQLIADGAMSALRGPQIKELTKWADMRKYDRNYLHVAKDGVPNHFTAMDGTEMKIVLKCGK